MRIIGGSLRGRALASFSGVDPTLRLRPTSDRTREAIFNILMHNSFTDLDDARVLDLFAGTGALGLEALSRGASHVTFVENNVVPRAIIRENIESLGLTGHTNVYKRDATQLGPNKNQPFDIVLMDPPYDDEALIPATFAGLVDGQWVSQDSLVVCECPVGLTLDIGSDWEVVSEKTYGKARIIFAKLMP